MTDGLEDIDSYFIQNGRIVKGGGGIYPDIEINKKKIPPIVQSLYRERLFLKFASEYVYKNNLPSHSMPKILKDFINHVQNYEIDYIVPKKLS